MKKKLELFYELLLNLDFTGKEYSIRAIPYKDMVYIYSLKNGAIMEAFHDVELYALAKTFGLSCYCDKDPNNYVRMIVF